MSGAPSQQGRRLDWALALFTCVWGIWVALPGRAMDGAAYRDHAAMLPEWQWGMLMAASGVLHMVALRVNGGAGWTPYFRAAVGYWGASVFTLLALGFYHSGIGWVETEGEDFAYRALYHISSQSTGLLTYAAVAAGKFACACTSVMDAAALHDRQKAARNG